MGVAAAEAMVVKEEVELVAEAAEASLGGGGWGGGGEGGNIGDGGDGGGGAGGGAKVTAGAATITCSATDGSYLVAKEEVSQACACGAFGTALIVASGLRNRDRRQQEEHCHGVAGGRRRPHCGVVSPSAKNFAHSRWLWESGGLLPVEPLHTDRPNRGGSWHRGSSNHMTRASLPRRLPAPHR